VICTSLGENVRFLNQFKGRSGRQGDPGETFVVLNAWEDVAMRDMIGTMDLIKKGESRKASSRLPRSLVTL
jgi:preprotein translocase subunit SecA